MLEIKVVHIPKLDLMFTSICNMGCKYCFEENESRQQMIFEDFKPYLDAKGTLSFFMFGGEPLANPKFLQQMYDYIGTMDLTKKERDELRSTAAFLITNGTLVDKQLELLRENKVRLQISLDGDKETHDFNRIFRSGKGSFDKIMENIELCRINGIVTSFHGVIIKETIPRFSDAMIFLFEKVWEVNGKEEAINSLSVKRNLLQIIFEQDYTDHDIDVLIEQMGKVVEYLWNHPSLNRDEKREALWNFLTRKGGVCGAGAGLLAVDPNFDIYPCHRQADNPSFSKNDSSMGNLYDPENTKNVKLYNSFYRVGVENRFLYGYNYLNRDFKGVFHWFNWCPSTNMVTSNNNLYYVNSKYVVMHLELARYCDFLVRKYQLSPPKPQERCQTG